MQIFCNATVNILLILDHGYIRISNMLISISFGAFFFNRNIPYFF